MRQIKSFHIVRRTVNVVAFSYMLHLERIAKLHVFNSIL